MADIVHKIRESRLFRVASFYVVASWILLQLGDVIIEPLNLPEEAQAYLIFGLAGGFPLVFLIAFFWRTESGSAPLPTAVTEPSRLAVLPFASADTNNLFGNRLADAVIHAISNIPELSVIASVSSARFFGETINLPEIRENLNVSHVIVGTVVSGDTEMKIAFQLIDTLTEVTVWSDHCNCDATKPVAAESKVASAILNKLTGREYKLSKQPDLGPEAYQQYLLALAEFKDSYFPQCVEHAERSIEIEPENILAEDLLAQTYVIWAAYGFAVIKDPLVKSRRHLNRVLAIDPDYPPAKKVEAQLALYMERDYPRAIELASVATRQKTDMTDTVPTLFLYAFRYQDAIKLQRRIVESDPINLRHLLKLQRYLRFVGETEEADRLHQFCRDVNRSHPMVMQDAIEIAIQSGNLERAEKIIYAGEDRNTDWWVPKVTHMWLGSRLEMAKGNADNALELAEQLSVRDDTMPTLKAEAYFNAHNLDGVFKWCDAAIAQFDPGVYQIPTPFPTRPLSDPFMAVFKADPRYQILLMRLGIDEESLSRVSWFDVDDVIV